jgi:hypothetical protein
MREPQTLGGIEECTHVLANQILQKHSGEIEEIMMNNLKEYLETNKNSFFNPEKLNEQIQDNIHKVILDQLVYDKTYYKHILYALLKQNTIQDIIEKAIQQFNNDPRPNYDKILFDLFKGQLNIDSDTQTGGRNKIQTRKKGGNKIKTRRKRRGGTLGDSLVQSVASNASNLGNNVNVDDDNMISSLNNVVDNVSNDVNSNNNSNILPSPSPSATDTTAESEKASQEKNTIDNILSFNPRNTDGKYINDKLFEIYQTVINSSINTDKDKEKILTIILNNIKKRCSEETYSFINHFGELLHRDILSIQLKDSTSPMYKLLDQLMRKYQNQNNISIDTFNLFIENYLVPELNNSQSPSPENLPPPPSSENSSSNSNTEFSSPTPLEKSSMNGGKKTKKRRKNKKSVSLKKSNKKLRPIRKKY